VENNTATLQLPTNIINQLIGTAENDTVTINLATLESIESVIIPRAAAAAIANAESTLEIQLSQATIAFDSDAMYTLGQATGNISLSVTPIEDGIYVSLASGNQSITVLDGVVTITVAYEGELPASVFYIDENGEEVYLESVFDEETGKLTFKTSKLGEFVIINRPPPQDEPILRLTIGTANYQRGEAHGTAEAAPFIENGRTMVPVRLLAEALGAEVGWNPDTRTVYITQNNTTIALPIDAQLPDNMGTPSIQNGRTFVPIRYIAETLGAEVRWNAQTESIYLYG
jgi:hypothetical protein